MSWLQSSTQFLQTSEDLHLRLWDSRSMQVVQDIKTDHHFALCCDTSPDGNYFVVGNNGFSSSGQHDGCETQVWDLRKSSLVCEFRNHSQSVNTCKFVSAGNQTMFDGPWLMRTDFAPGWRLARKINGFTFGMQPQQSCKHRVQWIQISRYPAWPLKSMKMVSI
eukprot:TRINITY_DN3389_c0_g2_i15.p1 TRINITY_DN3389_c0_g2~~TRINITY_DN3389_c0_g2_i15.p1  ORF type:complete len:164 (+),score=7.59 TRINITY_DN3389_c0_g2_i15:586-1077(+)